MHLYPEITFSWLNGFLLMIPLLGLRYGIPAILRKEALDELEFFPPVQGWEKLALKIYFVTNTYLIFSPLVARINIRPWFSSGGVAIYLAGVALMTVSLVHYSRNLGLKTTGVYKFSRNPMILGYFMIYIGTALLIGSWFYLVTALIYQIAVHGLVLSEERWCLENYAYKYQSFMESTPRYL